MEDLKPRETFPGEIPERTAHVDKTYFDRLSNDELVRMADYYGMDIPPDLDRVFIIEQLLDLLDEDAEEDVPEGGPALDEADFPDQAPLPKQYNITFMEVLIRDPLWAFVFWELRAAEKESLEASGDFEGYFLKVSSKNDVPKNGKTGSAVSFTVSVGNNDNAWYLGFPPDDKAGQGYSKETPKEKSYQVELCAQKGESEIVLASSAVFTLPALFPKRNDCVKHIAGNRLIILSGIEDLPIIRNGDREPRIKNYKGHS